MVGVFKQVFRLDSFSRRVTSAVSFCFLLFSVMPQDEPISSGVGPDVQEAIKQAFTNLSADLTMVIESRLSDFKRYLVEERDSSVASVVDSLRIFVGRFGVEFRGRKAHFSERRAERRSKQAARPRRFS